jgi:trehalose-6-phosphate synthase
LFCLVCSVLHSDGLNRYPMEYTLARKKHGETEGMAAAVGLPGQGSVIISEFVSSARVMRGAFNVNPWRVDEVSVYGMYVFMYVCVCVQIACAAASL